MFGNTLAKENAMVVVIFDAYFTVLAVIGILVDLKLAELAPHLAFRPSLLELLSCF